MDLQGCFSVSIDEETFYLNAHCGFVVLFQNQLWVCYFNYLQRIKFLKGYCLGYQESLVTYNVCIFTTTNTILRFSFIIYQTKYYQSLNCYTKRLGFVKPLWHLLLCYWLLALLLFSNWLNQIFYVSSLSAHPLFLSLNYLSSTFIQVTVVTFTITLKGANEDSLDNQYKHHSLLIYLQFVNYSYCNNHNQFYVYRLIISIPFTLQIM